MVSEHNWNIPSILSTANPWSLGQERTHETFRRFSPTRLTTSCMSWFPPVWRMSLIIGCLLLWTRPTFQGWKLLLSFKLKRGPAGIISELSGSPVEEDHGVLQVAGLRVVEISYHLCCHPLCRHKLQRTRSSRGIRLQLCKAWLQPEHATLSLSIDELRVTPDLKFRTSDGATFWSYTTWLLQIANCGWFAIADHKPHEFLPSWNLLRTVAESQCWDPSTCNHQDKFRDSS